MKRYVLEFFRRGISAFGFGPIVLAILYLVLQRQAAVESLSVAQVCRGIFSLSALAFIAGGMNVIYQVEQMPLMIAIFIHGGILYVSYLGTYLFNGWLQWGTAPVLVFSGVFVIGYLVIWAVICSITRKNAEKLNEILKQKQPGPKDE